MKIVVWITVCCLIVSMGGAAIAGGTSDADDAAVSDVSGSNDAPKESDGGGALVAGMLLGGLLGGGIGAAIGSASGKAGMGALIGAGVGAVGGTLVGASQKDSQARQEVSAKSQSAVQSAIPKDAKVKKRVMREYDAEGKLVSEQEEQ